MLLYRPRLHTHTAELVGTTHNPAAQAATCFAACLLSHARCCCCCPLAQLEALVPRSPRGEQIAGVTCVGVRGPTTRSEGMMQPRIHAVDCDALVASLGCRTRRRRTRAPRPPAGGDGRLASSWVGRHRRRHPMMDAYGMDALVVARAAVQDVGVDDGSADQVVSSNVHVRACGSQSHPSSLRPH